MKEGWCNSGGRSNKGLAKSSSPSTRSLSPTTESITYFSLQRGLLASWCDCYQNVFTVNRIKLSTVHHHRYRLSFLCGTPIKVCTSIDSRPPWHVASRPRQHRSANEGTFETALLPFVFGVNLEVPVQASKRCGQVCLLCLATLLFAKDRSSLSLSLSLSFFFLFFSIFAC